MTAHEIRTSFLQFFANRGHEIVPSISLLPVDDTSLLFTNAGMNAFKDVFLGTGSRPYSRAVNSQKVMRVSGKHNDLDAVGRDHTHHTFFEMLGSWSFGDYSKREAILWAWELLTQVWQLPSERLYASVYENDEESFQIWTTEVSLSPERILCLGSKDNFWEMGETGPCGPCTEIHYYRGSDPTPSFSASHPDFFEIWNLVFIQHERLPDGSLQPLLQTHVDTGMGLERIAAVLQHQSSDYDTDLFQPIIQALANLSQQVYHPETGTAHRVISDHLRALCFAISDGILPSNEGRGYVLRKILRRALRFGRELGLDQPFLSQLAPIVVQQMEHHYPSLRNSAPVIEQILAQEEESFLRTLNRGFDRMETLLAECRKTGVLTGDDLFFLYDTLGFPADFAEQIAKDEGLHVNKAQFHALMEAQRARARASWKKSITANLTLSQPAPTTYVGDDTDYCQSHVRVILQDNTEVPQIVAEDAVTRCMFITDQSPFYGERGGQAGDTGMAYHDSVRLLVFDTQILGESILHYAEIQNGALKQGDTLHLQVNAARKKAAARHHSALHVIGQALENIIGERFTQAGSYLDDREARMDVAYPRAFTAEELLQLEDLSNQVVLQNIPVQTYSLPLEEAKARGAIPMFSEKYPDIARVVQMGDFSIELCGGTHVRATGEIGLIKIVQESSASAGARRLQVVAGEAALKYVQILQEREQHIRSSLGCAAPEVPERVNRLIQNQKQLEFERQRLWTQMGHLEAQQLFSHVQTVGSATLLVAQVLQAHPNYLSAVSQAFERTYPAGLAFLVAQDAKAMYLHCSVGPDLAHTLNAGKILKQSVQAFGGNGGGKGPFAKGQAPPAASMDTILEKLTADCVTHLKSIT